jgi:hypothetical protein
MPSPQNIEYKPIWKDECLGNLENATNPVGS